MRATGMVRKMDELGRVVIPMELRRVLGWDEKDPLEILVEGDSVILRKFELSCVFCGARDNTDVFKGKHVCVRCQGGVVNIVLTRQGNDKVE